MRLYERRKERFSASPPELRVQHAHCVDDGVDPAEAIEVALLVRGGAAPPRPSLSMRHVSIRRPA